MKENKVDELIYEIEYKMLKNRIKKKELYNIINRNTVTKLLIHHEGTIDTLRKVINYIEEIEKSNTK